MDPFAGGGSIPLAALRFGCEAFASGRNPVARLTLKVMLENLPGYGAEAGRRARTRRGQTQAAAERQSADLYPADPDGATPIAYLWAHRALRDAKLRGGEPAPALLRAVQEGHAHAGATVPGGPASGATHPASSSTRRAGFRQTSTRRHRVARPREVSLLPHGARPRAGAASIGGRARPRRRAGRRGPAACPVPAPDPAGDRTAWRDRHAHGCRLRRRTPRAGTRGTGADGVKARRPARVLSEFCPLPDEPTPAGWRLPSRSRLPSNLQELQAPVVPALCDPHAPHAEVQAQQPTLSDPATSRPCTPMPPAKNRTGPPLRPVCSPTATASSRPNPAPRPRNPSDPGIADQRPPIAHARPRSSRSRCGRRRCHRPEAAPPGPRWTAPPRIARCTATASPAVTRIPTTAATSDTIPA